MAKLNDESVTLDMMSDPLNLQKMVLDDISSRFTGNKVLVDPNQTAMFLIEQFCTSTANLAKATEDSISSWLPKRALTSEDLYKHMSDYDYVSLFAGPSSAKISLYLDKTHLLNKASVYNDNYKLVVIPENTVFKLGTLNFGIFYPINIRINRNTGYITVLYDTSKENSIHTLNSNLLSSSTFKYLGIEFLKINLNVYQFTRTLLEDTIVASTGFSKKISYNDKFYAARFFTNDTKGNKVELHQELGRATYDPKVPTVRMQVKLEENSLSINIPQIYVDNNQIGSKIYSEIYTTKGDITPSIINLEDNQLKVNLNLDNNSSPYSKVLSNIPTMFITVESEKASGGNDGLDFNNLRSRVVNNSFHTSALITPIDLENYFYDKGFRVVKYKDNLTNLIYYAYKILKDSEGSIVPAANLDIEINENTYKECSTIKRNADNSLTILPNTLYEYKDSSLSCVPVTDTDRNNLFTLSKLDQITEFNESKYTYSPFHMRLITNGRYPYVSSYNLMNPYIRDVKFGFVNDSITAQMTISGISIVPTNNTGVDGYTVSLICQQSQDLYTVREEDIVVYLYTLDDDNAWVGTKAKFVKYENGLAYYTIQIDSDYHLTKEHTLSTSLTSELSSFKHYVNLEQTYYIAFMVDSDYFVNAITNISEYEGIPSSYQGTHTVIAKQEFTMSLGYALDDVISNSINIQWGGTEYQIHNADVPLTYTKDVYKVDEFGVPVYTIDASGNVIFEVEHRVGDIVEDEGGNTIYKYKKGEKVLDINGGPIVANTRVLKYYIQALMLDAKLQLSEHADSINYNKELPKILESYFDTIRIATDNLLERDKVYFKPMKTLGYGQFDIGGGTTITLPLELSLRFKVYLDNEAYSSQELQSAITNTIIEIAEEHLSRDRISMVEMAKEFVDSIVHVESVDVLGINGDMDLQTLTITDESVQPSVKQEVYLTQDEQINIRKAVDVEYVQATVI